ncbi:hypothetical protein [Endozoicomonas sp. YOMI1]|uniref:hypothetical protein n=1 Tax=Endozoicomonas sp. YOMI1 TaxID=2828739 RepID=UPI0021482A09|nr:hypothetical protein [Endozoicomonas sp. YOMI1]
MNSAYFSFTTTTTSTFNSIVHSSEAMGGQQKKIWDSSSFFKAVTTPEGPVDLRINKRKAIDERPITPDLGKKRCKITTPENQITGRQSPQPSGSGQASIPIELYNPAGLSGQNAQRKLDQHIDIGDRRYTREELAEISLIKLNQLLRKEGNEEKGKFVRYIRRTEKNKGYAEVSRGKKIITLNLMSNEVKKMQVEKTKWELENNHLLQEISSINKKCEALERLLSVNKNHCL